MPASRAARSLEVMPNEEGRRPDEGRSVGRSLAVYTGLRLLLFAIVWLVAQLVIEDTVLSLGAAVLVSAVLSIPMLKSYRAELNEATLARAERRRARHDDT